MLKRNGLLAIIGVSAFLLAGCGNAIPDMTPVQNAMVTQYAANLLLSYSKSYDGRLVDTSVEPEEKKQTLADAQQINPESEKSDDINEEADSTTDVIDGNADETVDVKEPEPEPQLPIETVLDIQGFSITTGNYEVCDSYPTDSSDDGAVIFAMNAASGNKLVVLHMNVANTSGQEQTFNTLALKARYKIILNGSDTHNTLVTMLEDDFAAQNVTVGANEKKDTVLITEVPEEVAQSITSIAVKVKNGDLETLCE